MNNVAADLQQQHASGTCREPEVGLGGRQLPEAALRRSPFLGPIYEGFIASEVVKHQLNSGRRRELCYFRDQQGLEVDLVLPAGERRLVLIEAKASRMVTPRMGTPLQRLGRAAGHYDVTTLVVHPGRPGVPEPAALVPGDHGRHAPRGA